MAYYKKGDMYLNEGESEFYSVSLWGVCLFLAGAYFASHYVHDILPDGWPKELRFASIVLSAGSVGGILAYFAIHIRILFLALD